mmetsp:Transcript_6535/g.7559  ORF Transcript_6535/g.7559 Transcript_6535/m.7559 type:complete len:93 (-) Transcript_6535:79-357(-)
MGKLSSASASSSFKKRDSSMRQLIAVIDATLGSTLRLLNPNEDVMLLATMAIRVILVVLLNPIVVEFFLRCSRLRESSKVMILYYIVAIKSR